MINTTASISSTDTAILNGIVAGFSEIVDIGKINKFTFEVKRIFERIKADSEGLSDDVLNRMAFHIARNRAKYISENKEKNTPKDNHGETLLKDFPIKQEKFEEPVEESKEIVEESKEIVDEPVEQFYSDSSEKTALTIRRAISDAFEFVENIKEATTPEHIYDEAQKIFVWYSKKFDETANIQDVYEAVFQATKNIAEEIVASYKILVDKSNRKDMRAKKREEAENAEIERQRISDVAKIELKELVTKMLQEKQFSDVTKEALRYFKLIYLDNKRDPEVVHLFPGTTRDQRYQWKARAVRMIAPHASEDARKYVSEKTKRKFAFAPNILIKAAQMFLMKCEENYE